MTGKPHVFCRTRAKRKSELLATKSSTENPRTSFTKGSAVSKRNWRRRILKRWRCFVTAVGFVECWTRCWGPVWTERACTVTTARLPFSNTNRKSGCFTVGSICRKRSRMTRHKKSSLETAFLFLLSVDSFNFAVAVLHKAVDLEFCVLLQGENGDGLALAAKRSGFFKDLKDLFLGKAVFQEESDAVLFGFVFRGVIL